MRKILIVLVVVAIPVWWFFNYDSTVKDSIAQYIDNEDLLTLETRYSADQIMDTRRKELLATSQHTFKEPALKFYPYLLIDVKYAENDKKTREGRVLWGLTDGEMVLDTDTWETTHGFADAIQSRASRTDFKILLALSKYPNGLTREQLQKELHLEADVISPWIESVSDKHLVVESGGELRLHMESPKLAVNAQTKIKQAFVKKPYQNHQRGTRNFSRSQIERVAAAAFGPAFTIRNIQEVYLPVHSIEVLNPDGTVFTTYWNALTGKKI